MAYNFPIIFVHGIQGSWLKNQYEINYQHDVYWDAILRKKFSKLHLSTINNQVDKNIEDFIFPHQTIPMIYENFIDELRDEVTKQVYIFTYDWRKDNRISAQYLARFVEIVLEKAQVHAQQNKKKAPEKVTLIGHSMGGLVIKWYVTQILKAKAVDKIDKIFSVGTPYKGSLKAIEALLPGSRNFFGFETKKSMRKASRTLPGLFQLLPSWKGSVCSKDKHENMDIFKVKNWQKNLVNKLADKYGNDYFQNMLNDTLEFQKKVSGNYNTEIQKKFYCIYGTGSNTLQTVFVNKDKNNRFDFVDPVIDKDGDGTVPAISAKIKTNFYFIAEKNKIIEFGGQHAQLLNNTSIQDYIIKILTKSTNIEHFEST